MRPEITAIVSCIVVFGFFVIDAGHSGFLSLTGIQNTSETAADIGIIGAPATLLLIAGEFDLTVGSMVGASQILITYPAVYLHWSLWEAIALALAVAAAIGLLNGLLVVKMGLPSFIVTLAGYFWIQGVAQGITQSLTNNTVIGNVEQALGHDPLEQFFRSYVANLPPDLWWWIAFTVIAIWVLHATRFGNWIYASGGDVESAKRAGVKTDRVKIALFMCTAMSTVVVAALGTFAINQGDVTAGSNLVFEVVTTSVIGGAALAGGFGSPLGAFFGALLIGMVEEGFYFTNIASIWYQTFVGVALIASVIVNTYIRRAAMKPPSEARARWWK